MPLKLISQDVAAIVLNLNSLMVSICQFLALLIILLGVMRALWIYMSDVAFSAGIGRWLSAQPFGHELLVFPGAELSDRGQHS